MLLVHNEACGDVYGEFLSISGIAAGSGNGKLDGYCGRTENDRKLAVLTDNEIGVVNSPSKSNVAVVLTNERKLEGSISVDRLSNYESVKSISNLLCGSKLLSADVVEAILAHRNEVGFAAVENKNTGCISSPVVVSCVLCLDRCLYSCLISGDGGGEVGKVRSYVSRLTVKSEEEVIAGAAKLLTANGNALNGYRKTYVLSKVLICCESVGNVNGINSLLLSRDDLCYAALDLLHSVVGRCGTGNKNGHTNLDTKLGNGVDIHLINVVTAYYVLISDVEVASGVAGRLGVDSNYNTLNYKVVAGCCVHVLFVSIYLELRNNVLILSGEGLALLVSYGELKSIVDVLVNLRNVYGSGNAIIVRNDGDSVGVNIPGNGEELVVDLRNGEDGVVCTGNFRGLLGHLVDVVVCSLKVCVNYRLFGFLVGLNIRLDIGGLVSGLIGGLICPGKLDLRKIKLIKTGDLVTTYHSGKRKYHDKKKC